jgi:hypothetical protein
MLSRLQQIAMAAVAVAAMAAPASAAMPGCVPDTPRVLSAMQSGVAFGQGSDNGHPPVSTDIANTSNAASIPEATTMILLGTGLLAAFRSRRQPGSYNRLMPSAPTRDRRSTLGNAPRRPRIIVRPASARRS